MPNFDISAPLLWSAVTIWPVVCIAVVGARLATRRAQRLRFGWDDWLSIPALILVLGMTVTIIVATAQRGLGYPSPKPQPGENGLSAASAKQTISRKAFAAVFSLQTLALTCIKLSCVFFYKRVFSAPNHRTLNLFFWMFGGLIVVWGIGFTFAFLFSCGKHFDYLWTSVADELSCPANFGQVDMGNAISNVIMDGILFLFPIPMVLKLKLPASKKAALLGIFLLGAAAIATSILRLVIWDMELHATLGANADQILVTTVGIYFQYIETCFALCAVCLPTMAGALKLPAIQSMRSSISSLISSPSLSTTRSATSDTKESIRTQDSFSTSASLEADGEKSHSHVAPDKLEQGDTITKSQTWEVRHL